MMLTKVVIELVCDFELFVSFLQKPIKPYLKSRWSVVLTTSRILTGFLSE